jgi:hypothetical protein
MRKQIARCARQMQFQALKSSSGKLSAAQIVHSLMALQRLSLGGTNFQVHRF